MSKKILFIVSAVIVVIIVAYFFITGGNGEGFSLPSLETVGSDEATVANTGAVDDLEDGCFYVWHNEKTSDIKEDLEHTSSMDVFKLCPGGDRNWKKDTTNVNHVLWFTSANDADIPTLYEGDVLLYVSSTEIPFEGISWERYADYGYSIGVSNLISDESGHYHINNPDGKGFKGFLYEKSDANELNQFEGVTDLFLDKVGKIAVRDNLVSDGGTVSELKKNGAYVCEWYTGSFYQDFKMIANIHPFCAFETYKTYNYEFLHSSCIAIEIPDWFKTGYYYANDIGLFRYVKGGDSSAYNGEAYDGSIEWNEPIIIKDDNGNVLYDPSTGYKSPELNNEDIYSSDNNGSASVISNDAENIPRNGSDNDDRSAADKMEGDTGYDEIDENTTVVVP